jgi:hypothetical protein
LPSGQIFGMNFLLLDEKVGLLSRSSFPFFYSQISYKLYKDEQLENDINALLLINFMHCLYQWY